VGAVGPTRLPSLLDPQVAEEREEHQPRVPERNSDPLPPLAPALLTTAQLVNVDAMLSAVDGAATVGIAGHSSWG